ncbi:hypothetical protein, partial [Mesorhizobium sp. M1C.F.Ca.ET.144.01.1.1]|uniref:hypothetical protein n=1 Tax=Mesorhizobium sp. M1C.F.Ca.ET.144.01.1.1 TaxID=2563921 RepID=UPI001AED97D9
MFGNDQPFSEPFPRNRPGAFIPLPTALRGLNGTGNATMSMLGNLGRSIMRQHRNAKTRNLMNSLS